MHSTVRHTASAIVLSTACAVVAGCNLSQFSVPSSASSTLPAITGQVHGGQQPVSGATIQLFAANTTTSRGASTALLTSAVTTNASGGFSITGDYTCPSANTLVYLVANGGNPGLGGTTNNAALAEMAALGTCGTLTAATFININELTTVASVEALAPFMADAMHVGSDATNTAGLAGAFATAASLVNFSTGALQPGGGGVAIPAALLNTLADILAACVNTSGVVGAGTSCGTLLANAGNGTATNTIGAMLAVVSAPATNVAQLFALVSATAPFVPALASAPADFTAPVVISLPRLTTSLPQGYFVIIDTAQHIWVYVSADEYSSATNSYQYATGKVLIYDNDGTLLHTVLPGTGGLYLPFAGVADPFGNVWSVNLNGTLSKVGPDGTALSPAGGYAYPYQLPPNFTFTPGREGDDISSIAADTSGNIWGIASGAGSGCYNEVSSTGASITATGDFCAQVGNNIVAEAAADGHGNVWFLGTGAIAKVSPAGNLLATGVNTNGCFDFYPTGDSRVLSDTFNMAYDRSHDQLWGMGFFSIGALRADGTQVFCDANGQNLPLIPTSYSGNTAQSLAVIVSAVDGGGNLWFASGGELANGSTVTYIGGLNELNSNGALLTPFNAAAGIYGLHVANTLQPGISNGGVQGLAIDAYGNIWSASNTSYTLTKVPGLAVPKSYQ